jgi:hypothetical protein
MPVAGDARLFSRVTQPRQASDRMGATMEDRS